MARVAGALSNALRSVLFVAEPERNQILRCGTDPPR